MIGGWRCDGCQAWNSHESLNCMECQRPKDPALIAELERQGVRPRPRRFPTWAFYFAGEVPETWRCRVIVRVDPGEEPPLGAMEISLSRVPR
jgi:hypothetical protein